MSFLYPRTCTVQRLSPAQGAGGVQGYGGRATGATTNQTIAENIPCSVQARREGQRSTVGLPSDGAKAAWRILTPLGALADGQVKDTDVFIDDLGRQFGVLADYTNSMGGDFFCERLEP